LRQHAERGGADEREARPDAALLGGLQEERAGASGGELAVDPDGGLPVGGQRGELGAPGGPVCRRDHRSDPISATSSSVSTPPTTGESTSASKQARVPVWQAAPTWS